MDAVDRAVAAHTTVAGGPKLLARRAGPATEEMLARVHHRAYLDRLVAADGQERTVLDPDTAIGPGSRRAALHAAGAAVAAVDAVLDDEAQSAFALGRPPGHHAEAGHAMGFCLYNNVAVAAAHAIANRGIDRVMIFDWDVHHGNGTMHSFYDRDDVYFVSVHQYPWYPGTGRIEDRGAGDGEGSTLNIPLPASCGDGEYRDVVSGIVVPVLERYRPGLLLVSAGYDAHRSDPLAQMLVSSAFYGEMASRLRSVCAKLEIPLALVLEGGYDIEALTESLIETMGALTAEPRDYPPHRQWESSGAALQVCRAAATAAGLG